ncbi:hypothetical protein GETHLI_29410 [Geothrix limicola]|uniref:Uncharacterized protein n=1 Tax=Geothrix limicola TaxID=2927978 RepID=A0ABQ5QHV3_9BACT|nr:hypothetical protein [Geothrix limicola]GLH74439.1 hypothetical protein GETHLI_29410 [Geothrix limicola]
MPLYRAFLQTLGATLLLALALACHGKRGGNAASDPSAIITGSVTYSRVPLAVDGDGKPTGLVDATVASNLKSLPARGVAVRVFQKVDQTKPDGTLTYAWILAGSTYTDTSGNYSLSATKGRPTMIEVLSSFNGGVSGTTINLVAEPNGVNSPTEVSSRLRYALRKAVDGSAPTDSVAPASNLSADTTVRFTVGLNDTWWLVNASVTSDSQPSLFVEQAVLETSQPGRTTGQGSGSRILGIGDTFATFAVNHGTILGGTPLDLHYWPGHSETRGSFIEFNRPLFPQAYDAATASYHYFGSIRGDASNDDAWDEGVILPLLARAALFNGNVGRTFGIQTNPLFPPSAPWTDLSPDLARIEGLAEAMAANLLKSPYLADTNGTSVVSVLDIRDTSSLSADQKTPYSAPALRALAWSIILKANSLSSPGLASDWAKINPLAAARFFQAPTSLTSGTTTSTTAHDLEPLNIYTQLNRLKETLASGEPVDLAPIFTDSVLTTLTAPVGITWPRPVTGPYASFAANWGIDPVNPFPSARLSMSKAIQAGGTYPNLSQGEISYAGFSLTTDKRCVLNAVITPALPAGAQVEVDLKSLLRTFSFTGSGGSSETITLPTATSSTPTYHPVRIRLKSQTLQPDTTVTLSLTPAP